MNNNVQAQNFLMKKKKKKKNFKNIEMEVNTFYIGDYLFGIDINLVQEINPHLDYTPVPHAPFHIKGVMNLRGKIVTVIDMREVLSLKKKDISNEQRNIIIESEGELIGLIVDKISDVMDLNTSLIEPSPRLRGMDGRFVRGVYKLDKQLLLLLNVDEVINCE